MNKESVKLLLKTDTNILNSCFCMVSDEGLEGFLTGKKVLDNPNVLFPIKLRCQANGHRNLKLQKIILSKDDMKMNKEEIYNMLNIYFKTKTLEKKEKELQKLKRNLYT